MPGHLKLFGVPALTHAHVQIATPPDLPLLLLAFVAGFEEGTGRAAVVERFWPEEDERVGRHNLSQLLYRHRKAPWRPLLEAEPDSLRWLGTSDVQDFRAALAEGDWASACAYQADAFLTGVRSDHNAAASAWLEDERRALFSEWRAACLRAVQQSAARDATGMLGRLLESDPLDEEAVQTLMLKAIAAGEHAQALHAYERFASELAREMGLSPLPATDRLFEQARDRPVAITSLSANQEATPFIGREIELAQIVSALQPQTGSPTRLLSICGPGGMGKSRLALHAGRQLEHAFEDGVVFVPLAPLSSADELPACLAAALGLPTDTLDEAALFEQLRSRSLLLILDNFEHVIKGAAFVGRLLTEAGGVSVMSTSREPLALQMESVFVLAGLDYPADSLEKEALSFEAVRLFLSSARRHGINLAATPESLAGVVEVCALLRGLPLGIMLAAGWSRVLGPHELARELAADMNLLQSQYQDAEPRHSSLRAVFDVSWELLDATQRDVLSRLSVFRGGFDLAAARSVTGTSIRVLLGLVTRSLLERRADGRFDMHEAVRQFSQERLGAGTDLVGQAHATHYLELALAAERELIGQGQQEWLDRLAADHDNLAAAHRWFAASADTLSGLVFANAQYWYWHIRGHYQLGRRIYASLLPRAAGVSEAVLARALHCSGSLAASMHDLGPARQQTLQSLGIYEAIGDRRGIGLAHWQLGTTLRDAGETAQAESHLERALLLQEEDGDEFNLSTTYNDMAILKVMFDDFEASARLFRSSLALKRKLGDKQGIAYALSNLALLADERGEDPLLIRTGLLEALKLKREIDDQRGIIKSLHNLALIDLREGLLDDASGWLVEGLERSRNLGSLRQTIELCAVAAQVVHARGNARQAMTLASAAASLWSRNALSTQSSLPAVVSSVVAAARDDLDAAAAAAASQAGAELDLSELLNRLLQLLHAQVPAPNSNGPGT